MVRRKRHLLFTANVVYVSDNASPRGLIVEVFLLCVRCTSGTKVQESCRNSSKKLANVVLYRQSRVTSRRVDDVVVVSLFF